MTRTAPAGEHGWPKVAARALWWWTVTFLTYLVLLSAVTTVEMLVGAALGLVSAATGLLTARALELSGRPPLLRWRHLGWLPWDIVQDAGTLLVFLARYLLRRRDATGRFDEVVLPTEGRPRPAQVRAYGVLALSAAPGCYVVDVEVRDSGADVTCVHRIGTPGRTERVVAG